jgi:DNA-binding GntR family transcriptional regulator
MIVTLKLLPGAAVSEAELSQTLGIGRTPIREALQRLARESLVSIFPRRGIFVAEINLKKQLRLLEVRREIERLIARSAARRATDDERAGLKALAERFESSANVNDDVAFLRTDREFNTLGRTRHGPHALAVATFLVHPLQAGSRYAVHRQTARQYCARHRCGRRRARRESER